MSGYGIEIRDAEANRLLFAAHHIKAEKIGHMIAAYIGSRSGFTGDFKVSIAASKWDELAVAERDGAASQEETSP